MDRNKYQRLTKEEKETLKELTLKGDSLNKISKLTGLSKTTIHYNVKQYKSRQWRKIIVNLSDKEIGELMGAFSGDGSYYHSKYGEGKGGHHKIRYTLSLVKDIKYAEHLMELLRRLNLNPFSIINKKENTINILVNSQEYLKFIHKYLIWEGKRTYSIRLKNKLDNYGDEFLMGFARGLMESEYRTETQEELEKGRFDELILVKRMKDNSIMIEEGDEGKGYRRTVFDKDYNMTHESLVPINDDVLKYRPGKGIRSRL